MLILLALPAALAVGACDRSASTSSSTTGNPATPVASKQSPDTHVSGKAPATAPRPAETFMSIALSDAPAEPPMIVKFPPAKVRLKKVGDGMQVFLYTDDPPEAASKGYKGNAYVFEMELAKLTEPAQLNHAQYRFRADSGSAGDDRAVETNNGVFLNGWDTHLQPVDVVVAFEGDEPQVMAKVVGTFKVVTASDRDGAPRMAMVQAMLPVSVESK